jgi:protocatechuate 3,4-dioxygenase beta subunit
LALITALMTLFALVVPFVGTALATFSSLNATPESGTNNVGDTHTIKATVTGTADANDEVKFEITSGPDRDLAGNGNIADKTCANDGTTQGDTAAGDNQWSCQFTNGGNAGTDTILVFADNNGNDVADSGEPSDQVTKTFSGPAFGLTLAPASDSAATGTCNGFTATVTDRGGNPVPGASVEFTQSEPTPRGQPAPTLEASDPGGDFPNNSASTSTGTNSWSVTNPTDDNGQVSFGVRSDTPGTDTVTAFIDNDNNNAASAGEPSDSSTKTWTAGTAEGVSTLDCTPAAASNPVNTDHTVTCTATNANGDPVPNVPVNARKDSGPGNISTPTPQTTDNDGQVQFTSTSTAAGTDQYTYWVDQAAGGTPGPDASEPQDTATKAWTAAPTNDTIDVTCTDYDGSESSSCTNPTDKKAETFTATVKNASGDPDAGVRVDWSFTPAQNNNGDDYTLDPVSCTTDADGQCTTTLTNPSPSSGDSATVSGTIAGQTGGANTDSATKTWQERAADKLTLEPAHDVNQVGTSHTLTATVTDQFGDPVSRQDVDFYSSLTDRTSSGARASTRRPTPTGRPRARTPTRA